MADLSVIIPFCNEYPQNVFTIQNIAEELRDRVDFEIIAVNNYVEKEVNRPEDQGGDAVKACAKGNKWLTYIEYKDKLSHWNAKRIAVEASTGTSLFFCDAHCIVSRDALYTMFQLYRHSHKALEGSIHLPLTYKILEWRKLIYALNCNLDINSLHYRFCSYRDANNGRPYEVPCMSTCGMMIAREIYDDIGGWPKELGIYGGGENFINFVSASLGYKKWIMPGNALYHHGEKRGYSWNYADMLRNRTIAAYMVGGKDFAEHFIHYCKGRPEVLDRIYQSIIDTCGDQRAMIKSKQTVEIEQWVRNWQERW